MIHEENRRTFLMKDGTRFYVESSRHSEFEFAFVAGETSTVVTCGLHGKLGESYEPLTIGWDAEKHAEELHGGFVSREPIVES
jgi:hypothetical protein